MNTTAGSFVLFRSMFLVTRLVSQHFAKQEPSSSVKQTCPFGPKHVGFGSKHRASAQEEFGTNAYWPDGNPCSSSSGSAVAVAAGLAVASVGSQTSGSIVCPASYNNIVGLKPSVGLISRSGIVPISATQDSAGPFGKTVKDVAHLLTAMAFRGERDEGDDATWDRPGAVKEGIDYAAAPHFHRATEKPLKGMRLGYSGEAFFANQTTQGWDDSVQNAYRSSIQTLRKLGAEMVEVTLDCIGNENEPAKTAYFNASDESQMVLWQTEMRVGLEAYIAG